MNKEFLPALIVVLMFALAFYVEPRVEVNERGEMQGYWNIGGQNPGFVNKTLGLFVIPVLAAIFYVSLLVIPKIEVYQQNLEEFKQQFWGFKVILVFVMAAIYVSTLLPALGFWGKVDPVWIVVPAVAFLFFYVGYMLNFTKRNYFIGVGTPWTLANEKIWEKTNRLAGRMFWICGVLALVSLVTPSDFLLWMLLLPVVLLAIVASLYSLWEYKKTKGEQKNAAKSAKKTRKKRK